jgi:hypothetical protein
VQTRSSSGPWQARSGRAQGRRRDARLPKKNRKVWHWTRSVRALSGKLADVLANVSGGRHLRIIPVCDVHIAGAFCFALGSGIDAAAGTKR